MLSEIKAWREFSNRVEERLKKQNENGYTGWDSEYCPQEHLINALVDDALSIKNAWYGKNVCIDIAARAMMVDFRNNKK